VRASCANDDQVLTAMTPVLHALYTAFGQEIREERLARDQDRRRIPGQRS